MCGKPCFCLFNAITLTSKPMWAALFFILVSLSEAFSINRDWGFLHKQFAIKENYKFMLIILRKNMCFA